MSYEIKKYGNTVLREKSKPVIKVDETIRQLTGEMIETMHLENGIGLAAQQIGHTEAICIVDVPPEADVDASGVRLNSEAKMPMVIINPEIISSSGKKTTCEEGCLSFPGIYAKVTRPEQIVLNYVNLSGETVEISLRGLVARAVQHEMDHLNGVVFIDRISQVRKIALGGKLRRLQEETKSRI